MLQARSSILALLPTASRKNFCTWKKRKKNLPKSAVILCFYPPPKLWPLACLPPNFTCSPSRGDHTREEPLGKYFFPFQN